ncbi:MAG: hypothetical protein WD226_07580 [Planctomycetota bacterium]
MIAALFLFASSSTLVSSTPSDPLAVVQAQDDVEARIRAVGTNVAKLLELARTYDAAKQRDAAKAVYLRVIELDPDQEAARSALRHQRYDGKWFESYVELAKYKREEEARMKAKHLARFGDEWVPEKDLPFLQMGWVRAADGRWKHPSVLEQERQAAEWQAAGHQFRADDSSWVAPADFEHWTAVRWKCGDAWLDTDAANAYHAKLEQPWRLAGEHFDILATCPWETANLARWHADQTYAPLVALFGSAPVQKLRVFVLANLEQYNEAAGGTAILFDSEGYSSLHGAYFADVAFDERVSPPLHIGAGVCYWDRADASTAAWGPFWVRWAAAQSFVDGLDPSWNTIGAWVATEGRGDLPALGQKFWSEKRLPRWLRYGAASYVERYLRNPEAGEGDDPWSLRSWAFGELAKNGGLRKLDDVFAFGLSQDDLEGSSRLYHEAGLLVAYLLDGAEGDAVLAKAHDAFRSALKTTLEGGDSAALDVACGALEKLLAAREPKIRAFAGLK